MKTMQTKTTKTITNRNQVPGVLIYKHLFDEISKLPKSKQIQIYQAVMNYAFYNKLPKNLPPTVQLIFNMYLPTLNLCIKKYQLKVNRTSKEEMEVNNLFAEETPTEDPEFSEQDLAEIDAEINFSNQKNEQNGNE